MAETRIFQLEVPSPSPKVPPLNCAVCEPMLKHYEAFIANKDPKLGRDVGAFIGSLPFPKYNDVVIGELKPFQVGDEFSVASYTYPLDNKVRIEFKDIKVKYFLVREMEHGYLVKYAQLTIGTISKYRKRKLLDISGSVSYTSDIIPLGCEISLKPELAYKVSAFKFERDAIADFKKQELPERVIRDLIAELSIG